MAVASAVALWNPTASTVAGLSVAALVSGTITKKRPLTLAAGWLLYFPFAFTLKIFIPDVWSYLASGLFVIVVSEQLVFAHEVSVVLESPSGVDKGAKSLVIDLSRAHSRKLATFASLAVGLATVSYLASGLVTYASELIAATVLLMLVTLLYASR